MPPRGLFRICCALLCASSHALPLLCPSESPQQLWARVVLSPVCLRIYRAPPEAKAKGARAWQAAGELRSVAERIASNALQHYISLNTKTLAWIYGITYAVLLHLCNLTFTISFAAAIGAEAARRRFNGPNIVAAMERFIDEHVRLQR